MEQQSAALRAMNDAVLAIAAEATIEPMLQRLAHSARELVVARYAAIGVPDGEGGFAQFITSGMSDEFIAAMGPLPRQHGLLGAMLTPRCPIARRHPPRPALPRLVAPAHPQMRSFLGVPIVPQRDRGRALPHRQGGRRGVRRRRPGAHPAARAHAALAIENARLYERSRELSIVEERNRLARELHDSVTQKLFGVALAAESAATLLERDPGRRRASSSA